MGLFEEPRTCLKAACPTFHEMPENTIREQTYCCAGGSGLNTDEIMDIRLRGGLPRGAALRHVQQEHGVNTMACVCAIDRATLIPLADYWAPGVQICGVHELIGNALILEGEQERTMNLRQEPLPGFEDEDDDWTPPGQEG
jgi:Fe-S oxidoreductase